MSATPSGSDDRRWSFRDLDELSDAFGRHLAAQGVGPGDRVALMASNRPEFVSAVYGISKVGAASVLLSPAWKALEIGHALELTTPPAAVADGPGVALLGELLGSARVSDLDDPVTAERGGPPRSGLPVLDETDLAEAVLVFSSGTTGLPKAVRHTHRSIGHATAHWCAALGLGPDDRFQVATPPSHILGLLNLLAAASAGATVRLHRRFDLDEVLRRIETDRMTLEMAVAPIALAMANHPHLEDYDLSSLRYIMWGATPVSVSVAEIVTAPHRGARGSRPTERASCRSSPPTRSHDPTAWRLDSAGLPPDGVELRVADLDTRGGPSARGDRGDPGAQPVGDGRLPPRRGDRRRPSPTAGTAPATSAGSSRRAGSTSPTGPRR